MLARLHADAERANLTLGKVYRSAEATKRSKKALGLSLMPITDVILDLEGGVPLWLGF